MSPFDYLIAELAKELEIPLTIDPHQSCRIEFDSGLTLQIDLASTADRIVLGSDLGLVPPGVYRTQILEKALIVNGTSVVPRGILGFSQRNDHLFLFLFVPIENLSARQMCNWVDLFIEHAQIWVDCLKNQEVPLLDIET